MENRKRTIIPHGSDGGLVVDAVIVVGGGILIPGDPPAGVAPFAVDGRIDTEGHLCDVADSHLV